MDFYTYIFTILYFLKRTKQMLKKSFLKDIIVIIKIKK